LIAKNNIRKHESKELNDNSPLNPLVAQESVYIFLSTHYLGNNFPMY
jgi:hypothetical protein